MTWRPALSHGRYACSSSGFRYAFSLIPRVPASRGRRTLLQVHFDIGLIAAIHAAMHVDSGRNACGEKNAVLRKNLRALAEQILECRVNATASRTCYAHLLCMVCVEKLRDVH